MLIRSFLPHSAFQAWPVARNSAAKLHGRQNRKIARRSSLDQAPVQHKGFQLATNNRRPTNSLLSIRAGCAEQIWYQYNYPYPKYDWIWE